MLAGWEKPSDAAANVQWTRDLYLAITPYLHGGLYVNSVTEDAPQGIKEAFRPGTYDRLVVLKRKYDPANLFRLNPNINPAI
jgi:hypothetical protein